ncbi:MAG: right-handed parallel beta-helix repeat-containing protein [Clostridiales bacterium]|nr:right-handed parallel beta-helix repeat-containing protein [Clostridiales bacterium]NLL72742.1 right-handed parallel beta-helix repeat-containing protein [Clostridiales bacterium]
MKQKFIYFLVIIICLFFLPNKALAATPAATLTVDGVLIGTYASAQEAVDAITLTPGSNFIIEIADGKVSDSLNISQQPNKNVVIKPQAGASVTFTNSIKIDGNGNLNSPETLLIEGLNFDFNSKSPEYVIHFTLIPPRAGYSYPHNITINGCTFKGVVDKTIAVQSVTGGARNISIINCTATDMHSLAQFRSVSGYAFVKNSTISNSSGGVNFYGLGDLIISNCTFDVVGYAVGSGQISGTISNTGSVTINNSILNSNSTEGTVVFRGDSTYKINIIHSNVVNANTNGVSIQNLNQTSEEQYKIDIVESDLTGQITGINPSTIAIIDDPNVANGPVNIDSSDNRILYVIIKIILILSIIILIPLIIILAIMRRIFPRFR